MNAHMPRRRPGPEQNELETWFLDCIALTREFEFHLSRRLALEILRRGARDTAANLSEVFEDEDDEPKKKRPGGR